jgi:hypothetical protein
MRNMIAFNVEALPLPDTIWYTEFGEEGTREFQRGITGSIWTVVAIQPNPHYKVVRESGGHYRPEQECFINDRHDSIRGDLFLLAKEGYVPFWWLRCCCKMKEVEDK